MKERKRSHHTYIRAVSWHHCGDIWINTDSEVGQNLLVSMVHRWLPKLSERLVHTPKSYPVLVHGFPTLHDPSHDCHGEEYEHLAAATVDNNPKIIMDPATLICAKYQTYGHGHSHRQVPPMTAVLPAVMNHTFPYHSHASNAPSRLSTQSSSFDSILIRL